MSHFFVGVIVKDDKDIDSALEKLMSPYDENMDTDPYETKCYCVGRKAQADIERQLDNKFGTVEEARAKLRGKLRKLPQAIKDENWQFSEEGTKFTDEEWKKINKKKWDAENLLKKNHPGINKSDPNCKECNGLGTRSTTYNPDSKWDYYIIGGRWDGCITNELRESTDGDKDNDQNCNTISVEKYLTLAEKTPGIIPFALVTPEGEWCERGKMGWWAIVTDEKNEDKWHDEALNIVKKYPNHHVVGVDCHI